MRRVERAGVLVDSIAPAFPTINTLYLENYGRNEQSEEGLLRAGDNAGRASKTFRASRSHNSRMGKEWSTKNGGIVAQFVRENRKGQKSEKTQKISQKKTKLFTNLVAKTYYSMYIGKTKERGSSQDGNPRTSFTSIKPLKNKDHSMLNIIRFFHKIKLGPYIPCQHTNFFGIYTPKAKITGGLK
jgi:hypothetical protein